MSDYTDIIRQVMEADLKAGRSKILNMDEVGMGNTTGVNSPTLNVAKLREMARRLEDYVQPRAFDLYGHDLPDQEQAYIIDRRKLHEGLYKGPNAWMGKLAAFIDLHRDMVIVHRTRLLSIYHSMKAQGLDVQLEPRYGAPWTPQETPDAPGHAGG
jgi:hypothetical protein